VAVGNLVMVERQEEFIFQYKARGKQKKRKYVWYVGEAILPKCEMLVILG
jgi:hypothetical protein